MFHIRQQAEDTDGVQRAERFRLIAKSDAFRGRYDWACALNIPVLLCSSGQPVEALFPKDIMNVFFRYAVSPCIGDRLDVGNGQVLFPQVNDQCGDMALRIFFLTTGFSEKEKHVLLTGCFQKVAEIPGQRIEGA